ncbi:MAG: hypothetical protein II180_13900, partial [Proteobacteria bacterium]|nr:hypothetical protein [Pseudomonadota bacterium]
MGYASREPMGTRTITPLLYFPHHTAFLAETNGVCHDTPGTRLIIQNGFNIFIIMNLFDGLYI